MIRSPTRVAIQPPSTAPIGSAIRNHSSSPAAWAWSCPSTPWPNSSTSTSVTISAAPADSEAPSAARNGRKCTPAGSISRVRAKRSQSKNSHRRPRPPRSPAATRSSAAPACRRGRGCTARSPPGPARPPAAHHRPGRPSRAPRPRLLRRQAELDHHHRDEGQRDVDPEHVAPVVCQQQTMKMPYSGPSTLPSSCAAPMPPSTPARLRCGPQIGAQREGDRQQRAAGHALDGAATDEQWKSPVDRPAR